MTSRSFCIFLLVVFPYPAVFCLYDYFQHIHNHNHKGHSTKDALSSTTIAVLTSEEAYSSKQSAVTRDEIYSQEPDDVSSEETSSSEDTQKKGHRPNETVLHEDPYNDRVMYRSFIVRIGAIAGSIAIIVTCLGCIICCCPACCRGKERRGLVMRNVVENRGTEDSPQLIVAPSQQPAIVQHFPPQYTVQQQLPPQYQQQPQFQCPPAQPYPTSPQYSPVHPGYQHPHANAQFHNPPEAPPPYEATAPSQQY